MQWNTMNRSHFSCKNSGNLSVIFSMSIMDAVAPQNALSPFCSAKNPSPWWQNLIVLLRHDSMLSISLSILPRCDVSSRCYPAFLGAWGYQRGAHDIQGLVCASVVSSNPPKEYDWMRPAANHRIVVSWHVPHSYCAQQDIDYLYEWWRGRNCTYLLDVIGRALQESPYLPPI